MIQFETFWMQ